MSKKILLSHGSGGKSSHELIKDFTKIIGNKVLNELDDSAVFALGEKKIALTTDAHVVNPIFFPGGDIGRLAVCGTVNDLAVCGAKPLFISSSFILEEGLDMNELDEILKSMDKTAKEAGVKIVTGDTKVVEKGSCDKIFITTSGIGEIPKGIDLSKKRIKPGDKIIINGTIGDHGFSIINAREDFEFKARLKSDVTPLNNLIEKILRLGKSVKFMRDPTRGGVATTLNEFVEGSGFGIEIEEDTLPIRKDVLMMSEILGIDPLYMGNEGKVVFVVSENKSKGVLNRLKAHKLGKEAAVIGTVTRKNKGKVLLKTKVGTRRFIDMPTGEQFPRIC